MPERDHHEIAGHTIYFHDVKLQTRVDEWRENFRGAVKISERQSTPAREKVNDAATNLRERQLLKLTNHRQAFEWNRALLFDATR